MVTATSKNVLYQNSHGFLLTFRINNLAGTTQITLKMKKPNDTEIVRTISGSDINIAARTVSYMVQEGDLDVIGFYKLQLTDTTPGRFIPSAERTFRVVKTM